MAQCFAGQDEGDLAEAIRVVRSLHLYPTPGKTTLISGGLSRRGDIRMRLGGAALFLEALRNLLFRQCGIKTDAWFSAQGPGNVVQPLDGAASVHDRVERTYAPPKRV